MNAPHEFFGLSSIIFRDLPLEIALERMSSTAFRTIDIGMIPPEFCPHYRPLSTTTEDDAKLKELIERYGFIVSSLNVVPGFFNKKGSSRDEVSRFIRRSVEIAQRLGVSIVTIPPGVKAPPGEWLEHAKFVKSLLLEEAAFASDKGVTLSLETPHKGTLSENVKEAADLHDLLDSPLMSCTLDTSHVISSGTELGAVLDIIGVERIDHVHLRDAVGADIGITPGKGEGDFAAFFQRLKSSSYSGNCVFELEYDRMSVARKLVELEFAQRYCTYAYAGDPLPVRMRFQRNRYYQKGERFIHSPVKELKKHPQLFKAVRSLVPDDVYEGSWKKRYHFNTSKVHVDPPKSIPIPGAAGKTYRIGIVGTGWAGTQMHAPGFERLEHTQLIGGFDIDSSNARKFAARFGCPAYESLDQLIEEGEPDVVAVCSKEPAHYEAVKLLLTRGVHVFCEKLMTTRFDQAKELVELAGQNDRHLGINYNYRFMPGIRRLKKIIADKELGDLALINITAHGAAYAHAIDLLSYLGGPIRVVTGAYRNDNALRDFGGTDWSEYDDDILYVPSKSASVTAEFANDALGTVTSSIFYRASALTLAIDAVFERGAISLNGINLFSSVGDMSCSLKQKGLKLNLDYKKGLYSRGFEYSFYESIKDYMSALAQGRPPETPGEQGLLNTVLEKAIAKSSRENVKVDFADFRRTLGLAGELQPADTRQGRLAGGPRGVVSG